MKGKLQHPEERIAEVLQFWWECPEIVPKGFLPKLLEKPNSLVFRLLQGCLTNTYPCLYV